MHTCEKASWHRPLVPCNKLQIQHPESFVWNGYKYGIELCKIIFWDAVITVFLPVHIPVPDENALKEMANYFNTWWGVPQCVGAIDGSHIPIIAPEDYAK